MAILVNNGNKKPRHYLIVNGVDYDHHPIIESYLKNSQVE